VFPWIWPFSSRFTTFLFSQRVNLNDIPVWCLGFKVSWTEEQNLRCIHVIVCHPHKTPSLVSGW